jgi:hypothetical protein
VTDRDLLLALLALGVISVSVCAVLVVAAQVEFESKVEAKLKAVYYILGSSA